MYRLGHIANTPQVHVHQGIIDTKLPSSVERSPLPVLVNDCVGQVMDLILSLMMIIMTLMTKVGVLVSFMFLLIITTNTAEPTTAIRMKDQPAFRQIWWPLKHGP